MKPKVVKSINVKTDQLITKSEYARKHNLTPGRITQLCQAGDIKTVWVHGAELILLS